MSNHKAHFRGDIQVDGQILGPDGQPVGGGVDWSALVPEINFAGDPTDEYSGASLAWDENLWGLALRGAPDSGDGELFLVNSDDPTQWGNISPYGMAFNDAEHAAFKFNNYGIMQWGPGTSDVDTSLRRTALGTLEIDHTLSFKGVGSGAGATLGWDDATYGMAINGRSGHKGLLSILRSPGDYTQGYVSIGFEHGTGDPTLGLRTNDGWLSRLWNAGESGLFIDNNLSFNGPDYGLVLMSPDFTYHRLTVANDGSLSTVPI